MTDPGIAFWLRHIEDRGGLWEPAGDALLAVLPPELSQRYRLPEEVRVTSDPDVAREDDAVLLAAGHPVLTDAAEWVLGDGDAGLLALERPTSERPTDETLRDRARAELPVSHGRIDLAGPSRPVTRWLLRVGALVRYAVSAEDVFQEQVERWMDVASRREVPARVVERLAATPVADKDHAPAAPLDRLAPALAEADRRLEVDAVRRRTALARQLGDGHERERARTVSYYDDVIAGIQRRLGTVTPDRRALLEERLASTREERARRLAEIAEKHQPSHDIRPYRLHLLGVPAVRLPVDVRRGERRYPLELDWLAPAGAFAEPRCPACDTAAPLVAGKSKLGCLSCLAPAIPSPSPAPRPARPAEKKPAAETKPAAEKPAEKPVGAAEKPAAGARRPAAAAPSRDRRPAPAAAAPQPRTGREAPRQADRLAAAVWNAVAARKARRLRDAVAPGSPAAALLRLYGVDAPRWAVGLPAGAQLEAFTTGSAWLTGHSGVTQGAVQTTAGQYPYALHWRAEHRTLSVVEVLTSAPYPDGGLSRFYWWFGGPERATPAAADLSGLDGVSRCLVTAGTRWHGLEVSARALAAWWRLRDEEQAPDAPPAVLAAGIHRLVAGRAGDKGRFREAADAYDVDEAELRRVDAGLRRRLGLGPARAW